MTLRFLILVMLEQEGGQISVNMQSLQEIKSPANSLFGLIVVGAARNLELSCLCGGTGYFALW